MGCLKHEQKYEYIKVENQERRFTKTVVVVAPIRPNKRIPQSLIPSSSSLIFPWNGTLLLELFAFSSSEIIGTGSQPDIGTQNQEREGACFW